MKLIPATYVQMAPQFGQRLKTNDSPVEVAAYWLGLTQLQPPPVHTEVLVQTCKVAELEPIGVARIDKMLAAESETGFMSGNVSSNVQSSVILPAWGRTEVNGFTALDGKDICSGDLQMLSFERMVASSWNDWQDKAALSEIKKLLPPEAGVVRPDESTTLVRVMHMRSKDTRYDQPSPVHTHGWLLVGDRGKILYEKMINHSAVSCKMMARAKAALSCERFEPVTLLEVVNGKVTTVDPSVLELLKLKGRDISQLDLSHIEEQETENMDEQRPQ